MKSAFPRAALVAAAMTLTVGACNCDVEFGDRTYTCKENFDCAPGFTCVRNLCLDGDAGRFPDDAGEDAGDVDAGEDAGEIDAGFDAGSDGGKADAGDGGSDAGNDAGMDAGPDPCGTVAPAMSPDAGLVHVYCSIGRAVTIDADLADWSNVPFLSLTKDTAERVLGSGTWSADAAENDADISGLWAMQWDNDNLYIAGRITDDIRGVHPASDDYYRDDCFQPYFDGDHDRSGPYGSDDLALLIRADNAAQQFRLGTGMTINGLDRGMASATRDTDAGAAGWNVEIRVPWTLLGSRPVTNGRTFGFSLIIDDDDSTGSQQVREHYLIWQQNLTSGPCQEPYCSTASLGDALLVGRPR